MSHIPVLSSFIHRNTSLSPSLQPMFSLPRLQKRRPLASAGLVLMSLFALLTPQDVRADAHPSETAASPSPEQSVPDGLTLAEQDDVPPQLSAPEDPQSGIPVLKVDGELGFNATGVSQKRSIGRKSGHRFGVDGGKVKFTAEGKIKDVTYGAFVVLSADAAPAALRQKPDGTDLKVTRLVKESYLQFKTPYGTMQFGNLLGPEQTMIKDALAVVGGTGHYNGKIDKVVNFSEGVCTDAYPQGTTDFATKIAYYTPLAQTPVGNFQLGVAYTPNTQMHGQMGLEDNKTLSAEKKAKFDVGNVAVAASYTIPFSSDNAVTLSAAAMTGRTRRPEVDNTKPKLRPSTSYSLGAQAKIGDFAIGAGYGDNRKSRMERNAVGNAGKFYNIGVGYTFGKTLVSASYYRSTKSNGDPKKLRADMYGCSVDHRLIPGIKLIAEAVHVRTRTNETALKAANNGNLPDPSSKDSPFQNNNANVVTVGMRVYF